MYVYAVHWHEGQWSKLYRRQCFLEKFVSYGARRNGELGLTKEARKILVGMERKATDSLFEEIPF